MAMSDRGPGYEQRLARERETFAGQVEVHGNLPPSAHHWSERHTRPKLEALGVPSIEGITRAHID